MLWYLLKPLRGTSQPPRLSANHPIRRSFYRHGKTTAQHWLVAMLISVAIAMGFSYPTIFLSENPTAGLATLPHHVWTTAKPIDDIQAHVDVEMRQIWVHGSYMRALDKHVLKRALAVQQSLVGDEQLSGVAAGLDDKLRTTTLHWGYHSPLLYWNNSNELIDADTDILRTINEQKRASSSLNVVLRPASVFAGKKFERTQLRAADALVITLMNKAVDDVGDKWQHNMQALTYGACEDCTMFPSDGHVTRQRVYEFSFTPLSFSEHLALTLAYSAMALYVMLSLRRMKAFRSRFGLVVTAITQMTCSILSSFTICAILKINLSMVPQNAYPFMVLVLGVENMFRLINAVLAYPPTMATELRIANALGDIGPLSVAAAAQNLTILAVLGTIVSPGVAAFCVFAAIATLFDVFFLHTFFVAVLSVDIRRLELQDALSARHNRPRQRQRQSPSHHTWVDALIHGRLPFSTRMAGTAVTTTFILSLNYHFFEQKVKATNLRELLATLFSRGQPALSDFDTFAPPPMNATLTPAEWMRMQDFDTAKEVMRLARPGADTFVIRLFAPLIVVLGGADRTGVPGRGDAWTHALRSFAVHHFYPVAVAIIFIVAFVAVLMNFLLYNEAGDEDNDIALEDLDDSLTAHSITLPHRLDIVKMASNDNGKFVTIGLDRSVAISVADRAKHAYRTTALSPDILAHISWPVRHLALDDSGEWLALHGADDRIMAFNSAKGIAIPRLLQYPDDHPATIFDFLFLPSTPGSKLYFLVVTSGGRLAMSCMEDSTSTGSDISPLPLMGAAVVDSAHGKQLLIVTMEAVLISFVWSSGTWTQANSAKLPLKTEDGHLTRQVKLQTYSDLDTEIIVVTTALQAVFLNGATFIAVAEMDFPETNSSVESFLIGPARRCPSCGSLALQRAAVCGESANKDTCSLMTWSIHEDREACMCLAQLSALCRPIQSASLETHTVQGPGVWCPVKSQAIIGLRKVSKPQPASTEGKGNKRPSSSQIRQRRRAWQSVKEEDPADEWEAYKLSIDGELQTLEIPTTELQGDLQDVGLGNNTALYANVAGPVVPLDGQAVAVAFGNTVKILRSSRWTTMSRRSRMNSLDKQTSISRRAIARNMR